MNPILFGTVFGAIMIYILICIFTDDDFNNYKKNQQRRKNKMVIEDYVSLETAKLLKEKGFNCDKESISAMYNEDGYFLSLVANKRDYYNINDFDDKDYIAPTLQIARKWLRREKYIEINISLSALNKDWSKEYMYDIFFTNERYLEKSITKAGFKSYEQACEEAIKYCITKLI